MGQIEARAGWISSYTKKVAADPQAQHSHRISSQPHVMYWNIRSGAGTGYSVAEFHP